MDRIPLPCILFFACSALNLVNFVRSGNGFSMVLAGVWLAAGILSFSRFQKKNKEPEQEEEQ